MLALAQRGKGVRVPSADIQQEMLITKALMVRIVAQLAREGLVATFPSRDGGLSLPHPASQMTLKDVMEAFEGLILLSECLQATGKNDCPFLSNCPVRSKWGRVQVAMMREMASITIEELAQEAVGIPVDMPSLV